MSVKATTPTFPKFDTAFPKFDLDAFVALQKANVETVVAAQKIFFDLAQTVAKRQVELTKELMSRSSTCSSSAPPPTWTRSRRSPPDPLSSLSRVEGRCRPRGLPRGRFAFGARSRPAPPGSGTAAPGPPASHRRSRRRRTTQRLAATTVATRKSTPTALTTGDRPKRKRAPISVTRVWLPPIANTVVL